MGHDPDVDFGSWDFEELVKVLLLKTLIIRPR